MPGQPPLPGLALTIVVTVDMTRSGAWVEDGAIAATLMQLQAHDLGLGSCWIQLRNRFIGDEATEDYVRDLLSIPEEMGILCAITIGHKNEERKPFDEDKMMWEKYTSHSGKMNNNNLIPTQERIVIIGAGNMATQLAIALDNAHCKIVQIYNRTLQQLLHWSNSCDKMSR